MMPRRLTLMNLMTLHRFSVLAWPQSDGSLKTWMGAFNPTTGRCAAAIHLIALV